MTRSLAVALNALGLYAIALGTSDDLSAVIPGRGR
jgi:hypothetical protein